MKKNTSRSRKKEIIERATAILPNYEELEKERLEKERKKMERMDKDHEYRDLYADQTTETDFGTRSEDREEIADWMNKTIEMENRHAVEGVMSGYKPKGPGKAQDWQKSEPAYPKAWTGKICFYCKKYGHPWRRCPKPKRPWTFKGLKAYLNQSNAELITEQELSDLKLACCQP
uniref:CCHC-type domain-containing protein n=1 Tax=Lotharella oceanica TaxID=641309 RepID=A0A7S2XFW5_9EUKA